MMRTGRMPVTRKQVTVLLVLAAVVAAILVGRQMVLAGGLSDRAPGPPPFPGGGVVRAGTQLGVPAIQPQANLASASGAHFTEEDVRQYIATHRPAYAMPSTPDPVVTSVEFLPAAQVSAQLQGESMGVPDNTLLCLVRLSGQFESTGGPPADHPTPYTAGVLVFDAHTGNLLISSVGM